MPGPAVTPVESDYRLPDRVDVVVIGGGIAGVSTAFELATRGHSVLLCEKGQIGAEQSSRNWGWVRLSQRDPREIPLMVEAIRIWEGLDQRLEHKTGYTKSGILFGCRNEKSIAENERWLGHLQGYRTGSGIIAGQALDTLLPGHRLDLKGALYAPDDGRAEPQWAAPAIAEGARAAGATLITGCAVRSLDTEAGRVTGVVTEKGRIKCDAAVLAGGAWSRLFAGNAGVDLPQLKVLNTVLRTTPVDGPAASLWSDGFAFRKREDGGYTVASGHGNIFDIVPDMFRLGRAFLPAFLQDWRAVGFRLSGRWAEEMRQSRSWRPDQITPFEDCRILDPAPSRRLLQKSWAATQKAFPVFEQADIVQSWAGLIDVTPDVIPVISGVDDVPGMFIATGFSGHGFGIGPGAGRLMADLVTGATPVVDPTAFRLSRFSDGSRIRPHTGF